MARAASLDTSVWLPTYGWWPRAADYDVTVILTPYHVATDPNARIHFTLRGYAGSNEPVWEHEVGEVAYGQETGVRLRDLDLPEPPERGGVLEVHGVRLDALPKHGTGFMGMWIDAQAPGGGGYVIPTIPIRAQAKATARDDVQVIPGILCEPDVETELLLINPIDEPTTVRLVASSTDGLTTEAPAIELAPWSAWQGDLSRAIPRLRRLLAQSGGIGSLAVHSSHRTLPYFGFRRPGRPIVSMDHSAPLFA